MSVNTPEQFDVLGTPLVVTDYANLTRFCQTQVDRGECLSIDFTNTQIVTMRRHEATFKAITAEVDYFIPDGMPLVWCMNRLGAKLNDRVYGPHFFRYCVTHSPKPYKHYFLGGSRESLAAMQHNLLTAQPNLHIAGSSYAHYSENDDGIVAEEIKALKPDFIWVGLGTPKQQAWMHRNRQKFDHGIMLAVGYAFDVCAGTKSDAPWWMQRAGLTWLFRMCCEPRRLLPRYVKYNSLFLWYLLCEELMHQCRVSHSRSKRRKLDNV